MAFLCLYLCMVNRYIMKRIHELIFFISLVAVLSLVCLLMPRGENTPKLAVWGDTITLRFPSIEEVLSAKSDSSISVEDLLANREQSMKMGQLPDSVLEARRKLMAAADSLRIKDSLAVADTIAFYQKFFAENPSKFVCPDSNPKFIVEVMQSLRKGAKAGIVSVFHYGDSQIEGDRITNYIRRHMQKKLGGSGIGLVPPVGAVPSISWVQTAQDSVERYVADGTLKQSAKNNNYGALAQVTHLFGKGTLNFKITYAGKRATSSVKLYCSTKKGFSVTLTPNGGNGITKKVEPGDCQVVEWKLESPLTEDFFINLKGDAELFALSLLGDKGINVTNVGLRGSSGTYFTKITPEAFKYIHKDLNTKLVLLEFGGNATPYLSTEKRLNDYYQSMQAQINYIKKNVPNAKIILIGPADMSESVDGKLQTYRNLESTIETLRKCALDNGCAFWNMYDVMGGRNSMQSWVDQNMAASDYIHFSKKGADRIAKLFVESLDVYDDYGDFMSNLESKKKHAAKIRKKKLKKLTDSLRVDAEFINNTVIE